MPLHVSLGNPLVFHVNTLKVVTIEASLASISRSKGLSKSSKAALAWLSHQKEDFFIYMDSTDDPNVN